MTLLAKLSGNDAWVTGFGHEDFVYVLIEALDASGFVVDFCATRTTNEENADGVVLVVGAPKAIRRIATEIEKLVGVPPKLADVARQAVIDSDGTESKFVTLTTTVHRR